MSANAFGAPIPLSEIESVLAWVDTFKLSRATKKINRDFSDAVLLAEILAVHYPKLVEMHNYPPRNSHALKLNNWMTLNRKVLKKLKLNLCCNTMEQLSNSTPGIIERVLVMVRDKIKRDEELEKTAKEAENNMSSGGSYYEACGGEDHVLVVPVKTRVNGVLETIQQKVVSYDAFTAMKTELKDAKDTVDLLKQKVDHLDSLIKLKDERITELQKQLDRKQLRRKDPEAIQNSLNVPFDEFPSPTVETISMATTKKSSGNVTFTQKVSTVIDETPNVTIISTPNDGESPTVPIIPTPKDSELPKVSIIPTPKVSNTSIKQQINVESKPLEEVQDKSSKTNVIPPTLLKPSITEVTSKDKINLDLTIDVERIKSDVFKEANVFEDKIADGDDEFKDSEPGNIVTIEDTIQKELTDISKPVEMSQ